MWKSKYLSWNSHWPCMQFLQAICLSGLTINILTSRIIVHSVGKWPYHNKIEFMNDEIENYLWQVWLFRCASLIESHISIAMLPCKIINYNCMNWRPAKLVMSRQKSQQLLHCKRLLKIKLFLINLIVAVFIISPF